MKEYEPLRVTDHAVERYIERHAPHLSFKDAERAIVNGRRGATKLRAKAIGHNGGDQCYLPDLDIVVVYKRDPFLTIITVLPKWEALTESGDVDQYPPTLEPRLATFEEVANEKLQKQEAFHHSPIHMETVKEQIVKKLESSSRVLVAEMEGVIRSRNAEIDRFRVMLAKENTEKKLLKTAFAEAAMCLLKTEDGVQCLEGIRQWAPWIGDLVVAGPEEESFWR